jgi:hypothetical protein
MADNFDLRKFLKESRALENLNPILRKEKLDEGDLRSKIKEMIIAELGNPDDDYEGSSEEDLYGDYNDEEKGYFPSMQGLEDEPMDYDLDPRLMEADPGEEEAEAMDAAAEGGFLEEAKKDEEEVEVEDTETEEVPAEEAPEGEEAPAEEAPAAGGGGLEDIAADMEGTEGDLMDHLMSALKVAKGMNNEKLTTQIGNTLKFFVSEYIGGEEQ